MRLSTSQVNTIAAVVALAEADTVGITANDDDDNPAGSIFATVVNPDGVSTTALIHRDGYVAETT